MANLSQFFGDAVASGQSQYTTDPRLLPVGVYGYGNIKTWSNTIDSPHEQVFWYNSAPKMLHMYANEWSSVYTDYSWDNPNFDDANVAGHSNIEAFKATTNAEIPGGYRIVDYTTEADTYVDVCNHSGFGGYLTWVLGLGNYGMPVGSNSYIKIIVDGVEYEFKGNLHYRNGATVSSYERLYWGCLQGGVTTTSPFSGGMFGASHADLGAGNHHRSYYYTMNDYGIVTRPEESVSLPHPEEAIPSRGFTALRFENSIRVQVKISSPLGQGYAAMSQGANLKTGPYFTNYAMCALRKDLVIPGF